MSGVNLLDLLVLVVEVPKLILEVFELGLSLSERLQVILRLLYPEPRVGSESFEELGHAVPGTLNRTSQEEDDLDDLLVLSDPVVEGLLFFLRDVLLEPKLDLLGRLEDVRGSPVDGRLNFTESRFQDRGAAVKTHINLEEGLQHLLGKIASSADSLLHLVQGVLRGVEKSLIHGPGVVL